MEQTPKSSTRYFDDTGQVYDTRGKLDRRYSAGGQLIKSRMREYKYNDCGDLVKKIEADGRVWEYKYAVGGLLDKVVRPDRKSVTFAYDPLGIRIAKTFDGKVTRYVWNGNNIIHEWVEDNRAQEDKPQNVQTWLFEDGTFTPFAKLTENKSYAVVADHLGSPKELINQNGKVAWKATLDMYGMVRSQAGGTTTDSKCNFRFPGQYEDEETGLCYNRFRYYMPSEGMYTQRDPIGLAGGNPTVYGYVWNTLWEIDPFGLDRCTNLNINMSSNLTSNQDISSIFRSVNPDEFYDIFRPGGQGDWFRTTQGTMSAKQFGNSFEETLRFANWDNSSAAILEVRIPTNAIQILADHSTQVDTSIFRTCIQ